MNNLTLENIASAVNGKLFNNISDTEVSNITIDSRKVEKDCLFIAIKGQRSDGHDYIESVIEKGALCVISEKNLGNVDFSYILVESSLKAIKDLGEYYLKGLKVKVIGITGSVGKTSTKEFIASLLSKKFKVLKTQGNFNNELGLPLTIFNINNDHEIAVLEMGISDFGEMSRLSKIARPDICVITNIGLCHLENLKSRSGILKAKTEMFDYAKKDFTAVLFGDDDMLRTIDISNKTLLYGKKDNNDIYASNIESMGINGTKFTMHINGDSTIVTLKIPGVHMVENALAAASTGHILGMNITEIKEGLESLDIINGRLNIIKGKYTIIDDCYNANPVSTKASIDLLSESSGEKALILGDMKELGEDENQLHYDLGEYCNNKNIKTLVFIGPLSINTYNGSTKKDNNNNCFYFKTINDFLENKNNILIEGCTVLVKASHSMEFNRIVEGLM